MVQTVRKYYKYTYSDFVQPTLSSDQYNLDFITNRYNVFDGSTSTGYNKYTQEGKPNCTTLITLSKPTCFTSFNARQARNTNDCKKGLQYYLYASVDGETYETLYSVTKVTSNNATFEFENNNYYVFYKFYAATMGGYDNDRINFRELSFTGTVRDVVESTSADYDFYKDVPDDTASYLVDNGTISNTNYNIYNELRPGVTTDTITYKEDANYCYYTNSSSGNIDVKETKGTIDTTKAFNPTLGTKRVRPLLATFTSTTVSTQWNTYCKIWGYYGSWDGSPWAASSSTLSSTFNGATEGTYNVTWSNAPFQYWWTFVPDGNGWSSSTQTLAGTLSNIVWEVENTGTHPDKDYKLYIVDNGTTTGTNYYINNFLRPTVVSDTITSKITNSGNTHTVTSSNIGTIYSGTDYPHTAFTTSVDTTKAFNPTLGGKRVRPISATISVTTNNADIQQAYLQAVAYNSDSSYVTNFHSSHNQDNEGSYFDATTKGTYPIHFNYVGNENFNYWWAFSMHSAGYSSDNSTVVCTLSSIVWEVENTCSTVPDKKYYIFQP